MIQELIDFRKQTKDRELRRLLKAAAELALQLEIVNEYELTTTEIDIGKKEGKIPCIKAVRERTGLDLKNTKDLVEDYFAANGYQFHH